MKVVQIVPLEDEAVQVIVERDVLFPMQMFGVRPALEIYEFAGLGWVNRKTGQHAKPKMQAWLTAQLPEVHYD